MPEMLPLSGVRVIDLTVVWSGPGGTALLGDLGAEVIRVEGNDRLSRQVSAKVTKEIIAKTGYHGGTYPDRDPGERPYERSSLFNWHARNKLSACMNLDTAEGREALLKLARISDVFVENNSNGVLEKLGIGHDTLLDTNPRLIIVRMPPLGMHGPMSNYLGYGPNFNSIIGISSMDGYEGEEPDSAGENYHMDEAAPAAVGFAVVAALIDRDRTGEGQLVELSQAENVMAEIGEFFLDYQFNRREAPVLGNSDAWALQDVFQVRGDDAWVAVTIRDDRDWKKLIKLASEDESGILAKLSDLGDTYEQREANKAEIKRIITLWCRDLHPNEVVDALQAKGIPAGQVYQESDVYQDPHLEQRNWFKERHHPSSGTHKYPGHPWRTDDFELKFGRPFPGFGEDNEYVYKELLKYSDEDYKALVDRGLVTDFQIA